MKDISDEESLIKGTKYVRMMCRQDSVDSESYMLVYCRDVDKNYQKVIDGPNLLW